MIDPIQILGELVAIPSINPMGRGVSGPEFFEHRVTDYLQQFFTRLGVRWQRQPIEPLRENIIARIEGVAPPEKGGQLILFDAHQDTVPVDGMIIPPFSPTVSDGRLYGRGSCDVKGGMGAMLAAFARLAVERPAGMPTLVMACTINEENGMTGANAMRKLWSSGSKDSLIPRAPAAVIVAEPTNLNVVVAHKGVIRWRARTHGRATHSSRPELGENAIFKMAPVLSALEDYQRHLAAQHVANPQCGGATFSLGTISGGLSVNTVPDCCTIEIERRILPDESPRAAYQELIQFLAIAAPGIKVDHDAPYMETPGLSPSKNSALAELLLATAEQVAGHGERISVPFGTNASAYSAAGIPSVVFGPGDVAQAHTVDEWIALDQVQQAAETYYRFAAAGL